MAYQEPDYSKLYHLVLHDRTIEIKIEEVEKFLREDLDSKYFIASIEKPGTQSQHYHIIVETSVCAGDKQRRPLKKLIKDKFKISGTGNLSTQLVKDKKQLLKYILKDDDLFISEGIAPEQIALFKKLSFKKGKFNEAKALLEEEYMGTEMDPYAFLDKFVKLKISYGQNLNSNFLKSYVVMMYLKKNPDQVSAYTDSVLGGETYMEAPIGRGLSLFRNIN